MLGCFCARFEADAILYAIGITAGVTFGLTIFAFQTKIDFTACGGMNQLNSFQIIFNPLALKCYQIVFGIFVDDYLSYIRYDNVYRCQSWACSGKLKEKLTTKIIF